MEKVQPQQALIEEIESTVIQQTLFAARPQVAVWIFQARPMSLTWTVEDRMSFACFGKGLHVLDETIIRYQIPRRKEANRRRSRAVD